MGIIDTITTAAGFIFVFISTFLIGWWREIFGLW